MADEKHQDEIRNIREEKEAEMDIPKEAEKALKIASIPKVTDVMLEKSRRERDAARRDVHKAILASRADRGLGERVEMLEHALLKPLKGKGWRHPIVGTVFGAYHQCAKCGGEIGDEVVMVVERLRSGDRYHVFCSILCLSTYHKW